MRCKIICEKNVKVLTGVRINNLGTNMLEYSKYEELSLSVLCHSLLCSAPLLYFLSSQTGEILFVTFYKIHICFVLVFLNLK